MTTSDGAWTTVDIVQLFIHLSPQLPRSHVPHSCPVWRAVGAEAGVKIIPTLLMRKAFPGGAVVKNLPSNAGSPWVGKIPWRRKQQPTPVFRPRKSHRQGSLVGCSPWGHKDQT